MSKTDSRGASGGGKARHKETEYGDEIAVCQLRLTGQIQPGLLVYTLSVAALGLQRKDSVVATESMQSARQKVFTLQPLRKFIKETFGKRSERSCDGSGRSLEAVRQESEMMRFSLLKLHSFRGRSGSREACSSQVEDYE